MQAHRNQLQPALEAAMNLFKFVKFAIKWKIIGAAIKTNTTMRNYIDSNENGHLGSKEFSMRIASP